jgi:hypothetical protein
MSTGSVANWTGNIADIGPIYPFVGSEFLLWVIGMALWVGWHLWQARNESREYEEEKERFASGGNLAKAFRGERIP